MKKIILILFVVLSFADAQTYTSTYKLPQWSVGDTLKVRTKNDSTQANIGLNYAFYRLEAILSRYIKSDGRFSGIGGYGSGNLDINAGTSSATPVRVNIQDSLYVQYNTQIERDLLVQGNTYIGGYLTTDSIVGNIHADTMRVRALSADDAYFDGNVIINEGASGNLLFSDGTYSKLLAGGSYSANRTLTIPDVTGTLATIDGNQNFTDVNEITADSLNSSGKTQVGTYIRIDKSNDSPNGTVNQSDIFVYKNGGGEYYFIIKYNDAGTIRYKYMRLDGTSTSWVAGTSLP